MPTRIIESVNCFLKNAQRPRKLFGCRIEIVHTFNSCEINLLKSTSLFCLYASIEMFY